MIEIDFDTKKLNGFNAMGNYDKMPKADQTGVATALMMGLATVMIVGGFIILAAFITWSLSAEFVRVLIVLLVLKWVLAYQLNKLAEEKMRAKSEPQSGD